MLLEHRAEYDSEPDAIRAISSKIGCHYDTLRAWLRQHKNDISSTSGVGDSGLTTSERHAGVIVGWRVSSFVLDAQEQAL